MSDTPTADTSRGIDFGAFEVGNYPGEGEDGSGNQIWLPEDYSGTSGRRADPQPVVEHLRRRYSQLSMPLEPGEAFESSLSWDSASDRQRVRAMFESNSGDAFRWTESLLPGFGPKGKAETARDDCGDPHPHVCCDCAQCVQFGRTCGQSVCSRCGAAWCRDLGAKKAAKLRRFRKVKYGATPDEHAETREEHTKHHHQIINPPLDWYYWLARDGFSLEEAQKATKKVVKLILEEQRCQGLVVRHSFRGKDKDDELHTEADDRGFWSEVLFQERAFYGDDESDEAVRDSLAWRPHYHCIVVSDWCRGGGFTDCVENYTGWVTHRIASDDGRSLDTDGAMLRATMYCLSHGDLEIFHDGRNNQSANWEVGSFHGSLPAGKGGPLRSTSHFSPRQGDLDWSAVKAREYAAETLGLPNTSTECGRELPAVDDPDKLAEDVLEDMAELYDELYPGEDGESLNPETVPNHLVLEHVSTGNIRVSLDSSSGDWSVSAVSSSWSPSPDLRGTAGSLPDARGAATVGSDQEDLEADSSGDQLSESDVESVDRSCSGQLIPLEVARQRGLLEDQDWLAQAEHSDEALAAHEETPDDLEPWRYSSSVWDSPTAV